VSQMWGVALFAFIGAAALASFMAMVLQQDEHRRTGLLPGPDPRLTTEALLRDVLGAVPVQDVGPDEVAFEDGSGLMLSEPDADLLSELGRIAAARDIFLERVYEMTQGWRLVFRGGEVQAYVDVRAWSLVAPTTFA
jgi:hypothetical protein